MTQSTTVSMRLPSDELRGNGNGAIVLAIMGSLWMLVALHAHIFLLACISPVPIALIAWGVVFIRGSASLRKIEGPQSPSDLTAESALQKRFIWIFAGEGLAIFLAVNVLANLGKSEFLIPTIGIIVGLHFLPLARLFGRPLYYATGAVQVVLCLVTTIALRSTEGLLVTTVCVEMAVTLWITIVLVLTSARRLWPLK